MKYQSFNYQNYVTIHFSMQNPDSTVLGKQDTKTCVYPTQFLLLLALQMLFSECKNATTSPGT